MSSPTFQRSVLPPSSGEWFSTGLWNVGKLTPGYTALQPRRRSSSLFVFSLQRDVFSAHTVHQITVCSVSESSSSSLLQQVMIRNPKFSSARFLSSLSNVNIQIPSRCTKYRPQILIYNNWWGFLSRGQIGRSLILTSHLYPQGWWRHPVFLRNVGIYL
jgi:hypothetical protein